MLTRFYIFSSFCVPECRDILLPLLVDQLSGQLDDNSHKPDHEACSQLLSNILEVLDRKEVVSTCFFLPSFLKSNIAYNFVEQLLWKLK